MSTTPLIGQCVSATPVWPEMVDATFVTEARQNDVLLAMTPIFTACGMIRTLAGLYLGQTTVVHDRFDPARAPRRHRGTE